MNESLSFSMSAQEGHGIARRVLERCTYVFALIGGFILLALVNMSLISIIGRKLFSSPIRGDMELMEVGAAVAIASFLPLCEIRGNHLKADAFTMTAPRVFKRVLDTLAHLFCFLAASILAWRTTLQMLDSREYGDVTTLLSIPLWVPLMLIVPSLLLLALCSLVRMSDVALGREEH